MSLKKLAKYPISLTEDGLYLGKNGNDWKEKDTDPGREKCFAPNCTKITSYKCNFEGPKEQGCGNAFCYPKHAGWYYELNIDREMRNAFDCCDKCSFRL